MPEELRVDAAADLFEGASEHQRRHPRGELDHVDAPPHLAAGLVQGFPVLVDDDLGKRLEVPLEQMLKPEHETARSMTGVSAHASAASAAARAATSTCCASESGTWAIRLPVADR